MTHEEINLIVDNAQELKNLANTKVTLHVLYPAAQNLYKQCYDLILKSEDVNNDEKAFLSTIYLYESLDCDFSFKLKKKEYDACRTISLEQQKLIKDIIDKYPESSLVDENLILWYRYLKDHLLNAELKEYFPIGKSLFDEKKYVKALPYFRRSEELLEQRDYSNLSDPFRKNHELNHAILKFNISQCQVGIYKTAKENKDFLERQIIKGLLESLKLNTEIISKSSDPFYENGSLQIKVLLTNVLSNSVNSWQTLYDYMHSQVLTELMKTIDISRYNNILQNTSTVEKKVDYLLFYTHGFNTRGEWKNDLTEVITSMERKKNINFISIPWDYGTFIIKFLIQPARKKAISKFEKKHRETMDLYGRTVCNCLVAHSFGTYITGTAIQRNEKFIFDKIIFAGNILDINYNWQNLKDKGQISNVLIEKSTNDFAVLCAFISRKLLFQKWIGYAGRFGFSSTYPFIEVIESKSGHSGMLTKKNMIDNWFQFLIK